jgi:hypothetical protein
VPAPSGAPTEAPEWALLGIDERGELVGLLRAMATRPCVRCGRSGHDIGRLTHDQKRHTLRLLRKLYAREYPIWVGTDGADIADRSST